MIISAYQVNEGGTYQDTVRGEFTVKFYLNINDVKVLRIQDQDGDDEMIWYGCEVVSIDEDCLKVCRSNSLEGSATDYVELFFNI